MTIDHPDGNAANRRRRDPWLDRAARHIGLLIADGTTRMIVLIGTHGAGQTEIAHSLAHGRADVCLIGAQDADTTTRLHDLAVQALSHGQLVIAHATNHAEADRTALVRASKHFPGAHVLAVRLWTLGARAELRSRRAQVDVAPGVRTRVERALTRVTLVSLESQFADVVGLVT